MEKQRAKGVVREAASPSGPRPRMMEKDIGPARAMLRRTLTLATRRRLCARYLDHALPEVEWRKAHPALRRHSERMAARKSFSSTMHPKPA